MSKDNGIVRASSSTIAKGRTAALANGRSQPVQTAAPEKQARFKENKSGLLEWTGGKYVPICSRMRWIAHVVDADGGRPAHVVDIRTLNALQKRIEVAHELTSQPQELVRYLTAQGVQFNGNRDAARQLCDYLRTRPRVPIFTRATHDGWLKLGEHWSYVLGNKAFSVSHQELRVIRPQGQAPRKKAGSLAQWLQVTGLCRGNPLLIFALCAAFASALLHPFGRNGFGVSFVGRSSTGKTTALRLALALIDSPRELATWASTANGLEALAAQYAHMPLTLDEIGLADEDVLSDVAYRLTNGSGKLRAACDGTLASTARICTVSISTGEESVVDRIERKGRAAKLGQFARVITIPTEFQHGAFSTLHGSRDAAAFSEKLNSLLFATHGVAWEPFVKYLAENIDAAKATHNRNEHALKERMTRGTEFDGSDGVCARVLDSFALMFRAGKLAIDAKVIDLTRAEVFGALHYCFAKWISQYKKRLVTPGEAIRDELLYFLQSQRRKLRRWSDYSNANQDTGDVFTHSLRGGRDVYLVLPGALRGLREKHGHELFHRTLIDCGWLRPGPGGRPTHQQRLPQPDNGRTGVYVFSKSAIFGD
ncbi:DUF927 domain-containing protein [Paraburkholderia hospita]|uniref:DUF927 domain-containing protein n=1 Tax=Paraburkholderia hospita TaxID=169430 RepID=UPI003ECF4402